MTIVYGAVALGVMALVGLVLCWRLVRSLRSLDRIGDRVARFAEALALLTEASEVGFRSTADELARIADAQVRRRKPRDPQRRVARARDRGDTVAQIAADEGVAEGEVGLRLTLVDTAPHRHEEGLRAQVQG